MDEIESLVYLGIFGLFATALWGWGFIATIKAIEKEYKVDE